MLLGRLLGLGRSAAVSGRLRRPLSSTAGVSHPSWAMMHHTLPATASVPPSPLGASVELAEPPRDSFLFVPEYLLNSSALPGPRSRSKQYFAGDICSTSGDCFLLISYLDTRATDPVVDKEARQVHGIDADHVPDITRFVCNPVTCELSRLPDIGGTSKLLSGGTTNMGLLTQADRHGPPDRYAVADFCEDSRHWVMERFLSGTREWEIVVSAPYRLPRARALCLEQEALAFRGRLWWVDLTWGAISADPFDDRPEPRFVELPRGSVLPERTERSVIVAQGLPRYRRMGVSEGRLRYAEVSQREPFVLSSFAFDEEGGGWTLEHRVALSRVWARGGDYPWLPLRGKETPEIAVLDPLNADVMYLAVGEHSVVVDMRVGEVIGSSPLQIDGDHFVPCVLPPWLGSSRIPSAGKKNIVKNKFFVVVDAPFSGKKNVEKNKTLADVLVRSDRH